MKLVVHRSDPDEGRSWVESHDVPEYDGMTVLDALVWVRGHVDSTLSFRYSCRCANACKQCLSVVDGIRTYTCTVPATGTVTVEPLPGKALIRDLVVRL
ncbi:MAG: 2Fe-2S iron-sulfur cluster-binding protein [Acidimicrobiales bacterium]